MHDGGPSRPGRLPWIWLQPHKVFLAIASTLGLATFHTAYGCGLFACVLLESHGTALRWPQRLLGLGAATSVFLLICLLQYAYWNAPGSRGRIPLEIVAVLCFLAIPKLRPPAWLAPAVGISVGVTSAVECVSAVVTRFYLP